MSKLRIPSWGVVALVCLSMASATLQAQRMVVIDQDGSGPAGSNQMAMMVLLQSPKVKVLGITMVSGNVWEPEEVQHTLRMLELIGRTDVPVAAGAVYPLVRTEEETMLEKATLGSVAWYGAWGDLAKKTGEVPYHAAYVVPPMVEGAPTTKAIEEDAAHFLVRQVRAHPHQVTIYAAGPLTNIALAISIDPQFAELAEGIVIMGGSLNPDTKNPEYATHPRHEFNFWFDPEAASITLRAHWAKITDTTVDASIETRPTEEMFAKWSHLNSAAARYLTKYTQRPLSSYMWDELAAAAWLEPDIITHERLVYMDVNTVHGPGYGDTMIWNEKDKPVIPLEKVHAQTDVDFPKLEKKLTELFSK